MIHRTNPILVNACWLCISAAYVWGQAIPSTDESRSRLLEQLHNSDEATRHAAASTMEDVGIDTLPVEALAEAANHPDAYIRRCVVISLGQATERIEHIVPILIDALNDPDEQVRQLAVASTIKIGAPAVSFIGKAMTELSPQGETNSAEKDVQTRPPPGDYAAYVLSRIDGPVLPALREFSQKQKAREAEALSKPDARELKKQSDQLAAQLQAMTRLEQNLDLEEKFRAVQKRLGVLVYGTPLITLGYYDGVIEQIIRQRCHDRSDEVLQLLRSDNAALRRIALSSQSLHHCGEQAVTSLETILQTADEQEQRTAVYALAQIGAKGIPLLAKTLNSHPIPAIREYAAHFLQTDAANALPALLDALLHDQDAQVRATSASSIAYLCNDSQTRGADGSAANVQRSFTETERRALDALTQALHDPAPAVKAVARKELAGIRNLPEAYLQPLVSALITDLKSGDGDLQSQAASAVSNMESNAADVIPTLTQGLHEPPSIPIGQPRFGSVENDFVRALGGVGKGNASAESTLLAILASPRSSLYSSVYASLAKIGTDRSIAALIQHFKFFALNDARLANEAGEALLQIKPNGTVELLKLLEDDKNPPRVREAACAMLAQAKPVDEQITEALLRHTKDADPTIRIRSAQALSDLGTGADEAIPVLSAALLQADLNNSDELVEALKKYGERATSTLLTALLTDRGTALRRRTVADLQQLQAKDPRVRVALDYLRQLDYRDDAIQSSIVSALEELQVKDARIASAFIEQLAAPDMETRVKAADALRKTTPPASEQVVPALVHMLEFETQSHKSTDQGGFDPHRGFFAAIDALEVYGPEAAGAIPALLSLVKRQEPEYRRGAIKVLSRFIDTNDQARTQVEVALNDESQDVRTAAAEGMLSSSQGVAEMRGSLLHAALSGYVDKTLAAFLRNLRSLRARTGTLAPHSIAVRMGSSRLPELPPLPWPPPQWTHIGVSGQDFPREFLGTERSTLGEVEDRIYQALQRVDPRFERSLFSVPNGFAMLAKLERINEDGTPLSDGRRWVYGEIPPLSLSDYIGHLFFENPGYFRVLVFIVTSENVVAGRGHLPHLTEGAAALPDALRAQPLDHRKCYVLVYSFERRPGGSVKSYSRLSAKVHLEKSGIIAAMASP